jgi:hypothetical protein
MGHKNETIDCAPEEKAVTTKSLFFFKVVSRKTLLYPQVNLFLIFFNFIIGKIEINKKSEPIA